LNQSTEYEILVPEFAMRSSVTCAIAALAVFCFSAAAQDLVVGKPAPSLYLERTIPAARDPGVEALKGKPTVIEFWLPGAATVFREFRI